MIASLFDQLWTVEADPFIHRAALGLFQGRGIVNVDAQLGDSRQFLALLDQQVCNDAVFFLDAHFSSGITSREYGTCPVVEEIAIIVDKAPAALVVVDDLREMNGSKGYPDLAEVLDSIPNSRRVEIAFDQLIIRGDPRWCSGSRAEVHSLGDGSCWCPITACGAGPERTHPSSSVCINLRVPRSYSS